MAETNALFDALLGRKGNTDSSGGSNGGNNDNGGTSGSDSTTTNDETQAGTPDEFQTAGNTTSTTNPDDNITANGSTSNASAEGLERKITSEQSVEKDKEISQEELQRQQIEKLLALMPELDENSKAHARATATSAAAGLSPDTAQLAIKNAVANSVGTTPDELNARQAVAEMSNLKGTFSAFNLGMSSERDINTLTANVSSNEKAGQKQDTALPNF